MTPSRRRFLLGATALLAAPAIVRVSAIMPVTSLDPTLPKWNGLELVFDGVDDFLVYIDPSINVRFSGGFAVEWHNSAEGV